jgi:hypothetical protein
MRQAWTWIVGSTALLLVWLGTAGAADLDCPAPGVFVVDTGAEAQQVADGFNCPDVDLVLRFSLSSPGPGIPVQKLNIEVKSFTCESPSPMDPTQRIQIVNDLGASELQIIALGGDIRVNNCALKAHKLLRFTCPSPGCEFEADFSEIVAAADFANPDAGGGLFFNIRGPIDIRTTVLHGGDTVEVKSVDGSVTILCTGSEGVCKSPLDVPIPAIIQAQCPPQPGDPPGTLIHFPCKLSLPDAAALVGVCFPEVAVTCNGGHKEKRFTAGTFLDLTGSFITSDEHVTFTCGTADPAQGHLKASGATFMFDSLFVKCPGTIDISNATLVMVKNLNMGGVGSQCAPGALCVNASGANITARPLIITANGGQSLIDVCGGTFTLLPGKTFPKLNSDTEPPYTSNVLDTGAECGAKAPPQPAAKFVNSDGTTTCATDASCTTVP